MSLEASVLGLALRLCSLLAACSVEKHSKRPLRGREFPRGATEKLSESFGEEESDELRWAVCCQQKKRGLKALGEGEERASWPDRSAGVRTSGGGGGSRPWEGPCPIGTEAWALLFP